MLPKVNQKRKSVCIITFSTPFCILLIYLESTSFDFIPFDFIFILDQPWILFGLLSNCIFSCFPKHYIDFHPSIQLSIHPSICIYFYFIMCMHAYKYISFVILVDTGFITLFADLCILTI